MKSNEELRALYENDLKPHLVSLESKREEVRNKLVISILIFITSFVCLFFYFDLDQDQDILLYFFVIGLVAAIIIGTMYSKAQGLYRSEFKEKVVRALVALINPEWNYSPDGYIAPGEYYASKLFTKKHDRYKGDDLVVGAIEKTDFRISELHTEYKVTTIDSKGRRKTTWHTIFRGLFVHMDFNKEIKGETLVLPDTAEKLFGRFGRKLQSWGSGSRELVTMEDVAFEKLFVVYGTDQIEARYILTPAMMQAMIKIVEAYGKEVYFSFIGSRVYFAIMIYRDLFEPRIFSSGVRFEDLERMNRNFGLIETLIHQMNLNTRIWTKD